MTRRRNYYKRKTILILGGAGFIGSNLAKEFVDLGARVKIIDGFIDGTGADIQNIRGLSGNIELYKSRIEGFEHLPEIVKDSDLIIDSMAITSHKFGVENPVIDAQLNLVSHLHLINALKDSKGKNIIYLGSRGQYGSIKGKVITEKTPQNPIDPQGINKAAAEHYFKLYSKKFGFNVISLRITNCFGENQKVAGDDLGLVGSFIKDAIEGRTVVIYGNTKRIKNLIYVNDLVKIITQIAASDFGKFESYNVTGIEVSLERLLDSIIKYICKGKYIVKPFPKDIKSIDVGEARFSDNKLRKKLGNVKYIKYSDLRESLIKTINYFKERLNEKR